MKNHQHLIAIKKITLCTYMQTIMNSNGNDMKKRKDKLPLFKAIRYFSNITIIEKRY